MVDVQDRLFSSGTKANIKTCMLVAQRMGLPFPGYKKGEVFDTLLSFVTPAAVCFATLSSHTDEIKTLLVVNNNVWSGSEDNTIRIWNKKGECIKVCEGHEGSIDSMVMFKVLTSAAPCPRLSLCPNPSPSPIPNSPSPSPHPSP